MELGRAAETGTLGHARLCARLQRVYLLRFFAAWRTSSVRKLCRGCVRAAGVAGGVGETEGPGRC
jgi:hypothetical protein